MDRLWILIMDWLCIMNMDIDYGLIMDIDYGHQVSDVDYILHKHGKVYC